VILSGMLGITFQMWEPQLAALEDRFRVVRCDHRGHGGSPVPPGPYRLEELGEDMLALMDRLEIERAGFVGLSLGALVSIWLGINAPERVDRLVLMSTRPSVASPEVWLERAAAVRRNGTEPLADAALERWFTAGFRQANPELVAEYRALLAGTPPEGYAGCCEAVAGTDLVDGLGGITAPTLVISGAEDQATPPEVGRLIAQSIPGARFEVVPAAHLFTVEAPDAVNPLFVEHFS
jgi:3-oxoadipate enol-lactonase